VIGVGRAFDVPGLFLEKEFFEKGMVKGVSGFMGHDMSENRHAQKGEISNTIKEFVAHKLILVAQAVSIYYIPLIHYDGIVQ
jgi:hypothetical protein